MRSYHEVGLQISQIAAEVVWAEGHQLAAVVLELFAGVLNRWPLGRKRRKMYVLRIVLSHSRKAYSEATFTQTTEDFFRCLENAFAHFSGVPQTLVIDNLKAAVAHPDWFDPELTPKVQAFCRHYGTVILPTKPYMPRHKGKVEAGVKYVKNNGLKGKKFASLEEENQCLANWERTVADTRIHGTTKRQPGYIPALRRSCSAATSQSICSGVL